MHHLRRFESTTKLVEERSVGLACFVGNGKIERFDMSIACARHHGEGHGSGFVGNGKGRDRDGNIRHFHAIANDLKEAEFRNPLVGIELVLGDLSCENGSLGTGVGAEGESRWASNDQIAAIAIETITLLALEEHVKARPRTSGAWVGSDAQESTLVPSLKVEEVKVDRTGGASEEKRRGECREKLHG